MLEARCHSPRFEIPGILLPDKSARGTSAHLYCCVKSGAPSPSPPPPRPSPRISLKEGPADGFPFQQVLTLSPPQEGTSTLEMAPQAATNTVLGAASSSILFNHRSFQTKKRAVSDSVGFLAGFLKRFGPLELEKEGTPGNGEVEWLLSTLRRFEVTGLPPQPMCAGPPGALRTILLRAFVLHPGSTPTGY